MKRIFKYLGITLGALLLLAVAAYVVLDLCYRPTITVSRLPAPKPISGAAVFYQQAFEVLPDPDTLGPKEKEQINTAKPLDDSTAKILLEKYGKSLALLEKGTAQPDCEWGVDMRFGPGTKCPQAKCIRLLQILCNVRARIHLAQGNSAAASDDLLLALRTGPHWEQPPTLVNLLIRYATDMMTMDCALKHLSEYDASSLQKLAEGFAAIPPPRSFRGTVAAEAETWSVYFNYILADALLKAEREHGRPSSVRLDADGKPAPQTLTITRGLPTKYLAYSVYRYEQKCRELEQLMPLPYSQARPQLAAFDKNLESHRWINGPFATLALAPSASVRSKEVQIATARQVMQTALAAQLRDPASVRGELAKLRDPYDDTPLQWHDIPGGIETKLKAAPGQKTMTFKISLAPVTKPIGR